MTVPYNFDVCTSGWCSMLRTVFRWRGSIWKSAGSEVLFWIILYMGINVLIENLNEYQQENFKIFRQLFVEDLKRLPLMFLLGFFVTVVFNRWVNIFSHVGFIDNLALCIAIHIPGKDLETKLLRRNIIRYAVLSQTFVYRDISMQVRKRFPGIDSIYDAGLISKNEWELYEGRETQDSKYWMPIQWAMWLIQKAREENKIVNDVVAFNLTHKLIEFRSDLQYLCCSDWVPVPLSYPQIVFLVVRCYLLISIIARQSLASDELGRYFPLVVLSIELLLIISWVKVAEALLNPFGEDDDDFECNYLIDRNLSAPLSHAPNSDELDTFWRMSCAKPLDSYMPEDLSRRKITPYLGSVANVEVDSDAYDNSRRKQSIRTIRSRAMSVLKDRTPTSSFEHLSSTRIRNDFIRRRSRLARVYEEDAKSDEVSLKDKNLDAKHTISRKRSKSN